MDGFMRRRPQETAPVKSDMRGADGPSWALTPCCLALWNTFSVNVGCALLRRILSVGETPTRGNSRSTRKHKGRLKR